MEYAGLIGDFHVNRPITQQEKDYQLKQKEKLPISPQDRLSVISINSTYLESVDKYFGWKGLLTSIVGLLFLLSLFFWIAFTIAIFKRLSIDGNAAIFFMVFITIIMWAFMSFLLFLLKYEVFSWTHYPIRLNRKNNKVYVFRKNGTILTALWDDLFFTITPCNIGMYDIRAHVLDKDRQIVLDTFALSDHNSDPNELRQHWEFIRSYMEDGPKDIIDNITYCMPVDHRREPYRSGLERLSANWGLGGLRLIMLPASLFTSLGRYLSMRTSKIPIWPKEVEDSCAIEPNDPYIKDYRINPKDLQ